MSIEPDKSEEQMEKKESFLSFSRRATLGLLGLGVLGLSSEASAQQGPPPFVLRRDLDANGHNVFDVGSLSMSDNSTPIANFEGSNLSIDASGVLNASGVSPWEDADSDNLLELPEFDGIDVTTVRGSTLQTAGLLEVLDEAALEAVVSGQKVLRIEPTSTDTTANIVAGHPSNSAAEGIEGATVSGGGSDDGTEMLPNTVLLDFGTIGGGRGNVVEGGEGTVGGGLKNTVIGSFTTVSGGINNTAIGRGSVVAGGEDNTARNHGAIGGGLNNQAENLAATISGGRDNVADGDFATVSGGRENIAGKGSVVGGGDGNTAEGSNSVIAGGADNKTSNGFATVGGGVGNQALHSVSTVSGGVGNTASSPGSTIGGGRDNTGTGESPTIGGGISNEAHSLGTVGGGRNNSALGISSTVPGGFGNSALADVSFAAGRQAKIPESHDGAFVWGGFHEVDFTSDGPNTFSVRSTGGTRFVSAIDASGNPTAGVQLPSGDGSWSSLSDSSSKEDVSPVDSQEVLDRVTELPISTWSYKSSDGVRHMGPMAQDLYAAFELGADEKHISTVDADGVALAAIQGLNQKLQQENDDLRRQYAELESRLESLETAVSNTAL